MIKYENYNANGSMLPSTGGGTTSTYYCDQMYGAATAYAFRGGACDVGLSCGAFATLLNFAFSFAYWGTGACLSCKPLATTNKKTKKTKKTRKRGKKK